MVQGRVGRIGINKVMVTAFSFMCKAKGVLERETFILLVGIWEPFRQEVLLEQVVEG